MSRSAGRLMRMRPPAKATKRLSLVLVRAFLPNCAGVSAVAGAINPHPNSTAAAPRRSVPLANAVAYRGETGLPIVTEVLTPSEVDMVAQYADCLQIGTRNAQNYKLLEACGNPTTGDPDLYLETAEWTYNFGPEEFMYRVLIRDGAVERIEELDRGVVEPFDENGDGY